MAQTSVPLALLTVEQLEGSGDFEPETARRVEEQPRL